MSTESRSSQDDVGAALLRAARERWGEARLSALAPALERTTAAIELVLREPMESLGDEPDLAAPFQSTLDRGSQ